MGINFSDFAITCSNYPKLSMNVILVGTMFSKMGQITPSNSNVLEVNEIYCVENLRTTTQEHTCMPVSR